MGVVVLRQVWSCLIEQVILVTFKKRSSQVRRVSVSEHRTPDQVFSAQMKTMHLVPPEAFWAYSGGVSISRNSPSSRSESARLSTESSKCICLSAFGSRTSLIFEKPARQPSQSLKIPPLLRWLEFGDFILQLFPVHHIIDMDLQNELWSLRQSQVLWAHNLWEVRGIPPLCKFSRQSDYWWRNLSTEGAWRCAGCTECSRCVVR